MNQETRNLLKFINTDIEFEAVNHGWEHAVVMLKNLSAEVEKQDVFDGLEIFCNNLKELFDEEDIKELVETLQSYDYFTVYSVLFKLLRNYLTFGDVKSWLSVIQTNDTKYQYLVIDYLSMRFHLNKKEDKDDKTSI